MTVSVGFVLPAAPTKADTGKKIGKISDKSFLLSKIRT